MSRKSCFRQPVWALAALSAAGVLTFSVPEASARTDLDRWRALMTPPVQAQSTGGFEQSELRYLNALQLAEDFDDTGEYLEQSMARLGGLYLSEGRYGIAVSFYREALAIAEALYGPDHARYEVIAHYRTLLSKAQAVNAKVPSPGYTPVSYPPGVPMRGMPEPGRGGTTVSSPPNNAAELTQYTLGRSPVSQSSSDPAPNSNHVLHVRTATYFPDGVPQRGMPLPELEVATSPLPPDQVAEPTAVEPEPVQIADASQETLVLYFPEGVPQRGIPLPDLKVASSPLTPENQVASAAPIDDAEAGGGKDPAAETVHLQAVSGNAESATLSPPKADAETIDAAAARDVQVSPATVQQPTAPEALPQRGFLPKVVHAEDVRADLVAATNTESGGEGAVGTASVAENAAPAEDVVPPYDGSGPLVIRITPKNVSNEGAFDPAPAPVERETWAVAKVEVAGRRVDSETKALEADPVAPPDVSVRVTASETAKQIAARRALVEKHPVLGIQLPGVKRNTGPIFPETPRLADSEEAYTAQLEHLEKSVGKEHPDLAQVIYKLARLYHRQSRYELAAETYERCLVMRQKVLPAGHPDTLKTFKSYIRLMRASGLSDQVQELRDRLKEEQAKAQSAEAS